MGRNYSDAQIKRMIKSIDTDGNGMISVDEFEQLLK
jgi:Ca2+-binding EF-hand superfamily protein